MKFSRLLRRDTTRPSIAERAAGLRAGLADVKKRAALAVKVGRIVFTPPTPAPRPVDRVALVNYASWLFMERRLTCLELYPHLGARAEAFVMAAHAADLFHFPSGGRWQDVPVPSARAVKILDMVGVDWRADLTESEREHLDGPSMQDTGERPRLPHGWPAVDSDLLEALDDLTRIDAAQSAMHIGDDRPGDEVPGYAALEEARDGAVERLAEERAESLIGLQAKARALLTRSVVEMGGSEAGDIATSLARDLVGASRHMIEPFPDPIHAAIEEGRRLMRSPAFGLPDVGRDPHPDRDEAHAATWEHFRGPISRTVPTTGRGCTALARYVGEFRAFQGVDLDDEMPAILANIARSPLL